MSEPTDGPRQDRDPSSPSVLGPPPVPPPVPPPGMPADIPAERPVAPPPGIPYGYPHEQPVRAPVPRRTPQPAVIVSAVAAFLVIALVATLIVVLGGGDDDGGKSDSAGRQGTAPGSESATSTDATGTGGSGGSTGSYPVAQGVDLSSSATWVRAKQRGHLVIGAKEDQPGLGLMDPATRERTGFDIEMARIIAAALGFDPAKNEYKTVPSANRETALQSGDVDFYIGTYSITDKRKETVGFAGPYYVSGQGLLVDADDNEITGKETIKGKRVCSAKGSTPAQRIKTEYPDSVLVEYDTYSLCVDALLTGEVDAVTTDESILKGYASRDPRLKVVGQPFSVEKYGIGMAKPDITLRGAANAAIEKSLNDGTWHEAYELTLGRANAPDPATPMVERY